MVEEVYPDIFRIGVILPDNPLRELNSYFIRGNTRDLLIDTGFRHEACRESLEAGLAELHSDPARRDVLLTHLHSDHSGMADLFAGEDGKIFMGHEDWRYYQRYFEPDLKIELDSRFLEEGFTEEQLGILERVNPALTEGMGYPDINRIHILHDGDVVYAGGYKLETILVSGHTPGNCMFYLREQKIMFTGDHILFDITPNITWWPGVEDSLGTYLDQLRRVRDLPVTLPLPGHRLPGIYRERVDALLAHHKRRIAEAEKIVKTMPGMCACEIAGEMHWKIRARNWNVFPLIQKWFAVGECMSHLDYLMKKRKITYRIRDGIRQYYAVE